MYPYINGGERGTLNRTSEAGPGVNSCGNLPVLDIFSLELSSLEEPG